MGFQISQDGNKIPNFNLPNKNESIVYVVCMYYYDYLGIAIETI